MGSVSAPEWSGMDDFGGSACPQKPPHLKAGDLVTGVDCPEGAPRWVGLLASGALGPSSAPMLGTSWRVRRLGEMTCLGAFGGHLRPLTDAEAITMVEGLTWGLWGNSPPTVAASRLYLAHLCRGDTP